MKLRSLLCASLLAALLAAGCGSDSEPESSTSPTTTVSGDTATTPTNPPDDGTEDNGDKTDDDDDDDDALDAAAVGAMCEDFGLAMQQAVAASAGVTAGDTDIVDSVAYLRAFADASPEVIKDDITVVYEGYALIAETMVESGYDPSSGKQPTAAQIAALQTAFQALSAKDFTDAATRVNEWIAEGCSN